jgi:hypothetical protein
MMKKALSILTLSTVVLFGFSAIAADKVVVVPLGGKKPAGDAIAADVLEGKTFSNKDDVNIPGTMANNPAVSYIPGTSDQSISEGYHNGSDLVAGDEDLISENIKAGTTIFAVPGKTEVVDTSTGDANNEHILKNKKAWVDGVERTGSTGLFWGCRPGTEGWDLGHCRDDCRASLNITDPENTQCADFCRDVSSSFRVNLDLYMATMFVCGGSGGM